MNTKLTLRLDDDVISRMKNYTNKQRVSLSKFTEQLFRQILESSEEDSKDLSPSVKKYMGVIRNQKLNEMDELADHLTVKHS